MHPCSPATTIRLQALDKGRRTELSLQIECSSAAPASTFRKLIRLLNSLNGSPVSIVLAVGTDSSAWCEQWASNLSEVATDSIEVRFELLTQDGEQ